MSLRLVNHLLIVAAIAVIAGTVWVVGQTQRSTVTDSFRQTQAAQGMLTAMLDQETGLRGYLLTRRTEFLQPFTMGEREYAASVAETRRRTASDDHTTNALIERADEIAAAWHRKADDAIAEVRMAGRSRSPISDAVARKATMDAFRRADAALLDRLADRRRSALDRATTLSTLLVVLIGVAFLFGAWLAFGRRAAARSRRTRQETERRERQSGFARTLQVMDSESETHDLVKRHLERSIPDAKVVVLQRNNSADRLEPVTAIDSATPFAVELVDAAPRDCLAVRMGSTFEGGGDELLECTLCGTTAAELTTCTPLLVQGEVIGSVLVTHEEPLGEDCQIHIEETVTQAAPVIANMRNLAIAEERAATDALTGLANRRAITDTVRRMVAQAERTQQSLAVLALDLDHFKRINDRFGHDKGDDVLAAAADALQHSLRESDFVGRQGGEEFVALLPDTGLDGALVAAENVRAAIAALTVPAVDRALSVSIGVAVFPEDGGEPESLLRRADRALYLAKDRGRNRVESAAGAQVASPQTAA